MSKKVIAFVGMPGSGKGTCSDYLHDKYDWPLIHFGNMVYEEVQRRGLHNVHDEVFVREDMRKREGPAVLAKHVARKAEEFLKEGKEIVIFDGLYSWSEYRYLEETFGDDMLVIAIAAPKKLRRERVVNRKDSHRSYTHEQLVAREIAEIENIEKGGPIAFADYTIVNDETLDDLITKLEKILTTEQITPQD
jgi:dephospho-CoA kinase